MKRSFKKALTALLALAALLSMSFSAFAAETVNKDGLSKSDGLTFEVKTDDDTYSSGDTAEFTIKVTNTNKFDVADVDITYTLPTNFKATTTDLPSVIDSIKAGESKTITFKTEVTSETKDPAATTMFIIIGAVAAVVIIAVIVFFVIKSKKAKTAVASILIAVLFGGSLSSLFSVKAIAEDEVSTMDQYKRVSVHDPSIVKDSKTGMYYIFGSHKAFAKSKDLKSWQMFSNNVATSADTLLGDVWTNYSYTKANPSIAGNLWAPDVVYNDTMKKWCMYMSVNGNDHHSVITLLTADNIEGPYEYVGGVMYSGMNGTSEAVQAAEVFWFNAAKTITVNSEEVTLKMRVTFKEDKGVSEVKTRADYSDVYKVLGEGADLSRYNSIDISKVNAIDPSVTYDKDGNLWMTYGSWSAGIYQIKLDTKTGLRDYNQKYEFKANQSDPYLGYKIAGGQYNSGEGPYILKTDKYYYLFLSLGNLEASGGYNMRVYRSESINGPFLDQNGKSAITTAWSNTMGYIEDGQKTTKWTNTKKYTSLLGYKIMGAYKMYGTLKTYVAQGHNSAFVDESGKMFLVYHTRFADSGEGHEVRVHQLGMTEDGWIVPTPYEYAGESFGKTYTKDQVAGKYEFILHAQNMVYAANATGDRGIATPKNISLNADGTITGDLTGTWQLKDNDKAVMIIAGINYTGLFIEQQNELATKDKTMTFTLIGGNQAAWGVKNPALK